MSDLVDYLGRPVLGTASIGVHTITTATLTTPVDIAAGATVALFDVTPNIAGPDPTDLLVELSLPALELTATGGGEAVFEFAAGGDVYAFGHVLADRRFMWPVRVLRIADAVTPGPHPFTVSVRSVTGPLTCHAGADYGEIRLRVLTPD